GGNHHAIVTGLILQEQDNSNNVVFQWRSWDHFKITDAAEDIILTDSLIDYVHGNAIEVDYDGNLLISSRHMDEITKIDRTTGDIIWRWGGIHCKNNEFTFVNDPSGFSHQHCIRRLTNGNYTIFDNGNLHSPQYSRATEYQLDEENRIATLVWENRNIPLTYSGAMGSVQRLANHNTIIGWGTNNAPPGIKEVGVDGSLQLSFTFSDTTFCYRAFKHDWDSGVFTSDKDHLSFGIVPAGQSATLSFNLTNNYPETVEINSIFNRESAYTLQQQLPITLAPQNSVTLSVKFNPETEGAFVDDLHLRWETEGQRIAEVIHLNGYTDSTYLGIEGNIVPSEFFVDQNYPNPFNPITKIKYNLPHNSFVNLRVYDILGSEITTLVNAEQPSGNYEVEFNGADLASGIYFYRFDAGGFTSVKKMLLLK
ncbi:MAG TPA: aryl-sulfate sulfotransferase, partial [Ignavibacteriaceae bacterium]|nr:aryl-sulfate sulfotransferase [Ignavibacteriaceae bacterium]